MNCLNFGDSLKRLDNKSRIAEPH
ncbi:uncharacterized protein METZ01_LOCUS470427 [marine metagenome]|uniref:Uncharacterized protein n=1 Tax=marine metagenome TaxID=408172 RepID=A0A383BCN0_9ZZZZ